MNRNTLFRTAAAVSIMGIISAPAFAVITPVLGSASDFAVLGHTTVTNTGPSVIFGSASTLSNVGVFSPGGANSIPGFAPEPANTFLGLGTHPDGPGIVNAPTAIHLGTAVADQARNDLINAFSNLASYGTASSLTGEVLGDGVGGTVPTLVAGVYSFASSAQLNGKLQLDAQGTDGGVWIIQVGTDFTTASASAVELINPGGNLGSDVGVFWLIGTDAVDGVGSATLGTTTAFEGNILAYTSITLNTEATIYNGRALAIHGAVTLDTNFISNICLDVSELPFNVTGPGSTSPNSGPGFSSGIGFDNVTGQLALIPLNDDDNGSGPGDDQSGVPEPVTSSLLGMAMMGLMYSTSRRSTQRA